jgi:hypothetical protein
VDASDIDCSVATDDDESGAISACKDGLDNDFDGWIDSKDPDCSGGSAERGYSSSLACNDGKDNDGDGATDSEDGPCSTATSATEVSTCQDTKDNDGDQWIDAKDPDCIDPIVGEEKGTSPSYVCANASDDDGDGKTDASDYGCQDGFDSDENASPQPSSFSPDNSLTSGGVLVTIKGTRFTGVSQVKFGDLPGSDLEVVSDTELHVKAPTASIGSYRIYVVGPDGTTAATQRFYFTTAGGSTLDDAILSSPYTKTTLVNVTTPLEAQVTDAGVTDKSGAGRGIYADIGYGPLGSDPTASIEWIWIDALYKSDSSDGKSDNYVGNLNIDTAGTYAYTIRFTTDFIHYVYADQTGNLDGFNASVIGTLTVE